MTAEIELVTRIQAIDTKVAELEKGVAALPKHIALIEKALEGHWRRLEADKAALTANVKGRKSLEDDIKVHEQKVSKLKEQMAGAKNNEQYKAFNNEIAFAQGEIRKCEDRILGLMGQFEPLEAAVKTAESALAVEKKQVDGEKAKARAKLAADQAKQAELLADRAKLAAELKPTVLATYERIRKKRKGIAVAEVAGGRCSACMIALRNQYLQDLRKTEAIMTCESCGCILYYNVPVSSESDVAAGPRK